APVCRLTFVLAKVGHGAQAAIVLEPIKRGASTGIVRHHREPASPVDGYIARIGAAGCKLIELEQLARFVVELKRVDTTLVLLLPALTHLFDSIKGLAIRPDCQKRRVSHLGRKFEVGQTPRSHVELAPVDPPASIFTGPGVSPDKNPVLTG